MFTQRKKNIVKEYDVATQSMKLASQIYKGSIELVSHSENRMISIRDKQADFNIRVEWVDGRVGVFLPEEEYQMETVPPQSGNPPCRGVRQIKSGKSPISQENTITNVPWLPGPKKSLGRRRYTCLFVCMCVCVCVCVRALNCVCGCVCDYVHLPYLHHICFVSILHVCNTKKYIAQ